MDKKVHTIKMWTGRVHERVTGTLVATEKNLQKFRNRLFRRSSEKMHKNEDSNKTDAPRTCGR